LSPRRLILCAVLLGLAAAPVTAWTPLGTYLLGAAQASSHRLPPGNITVPTARTLAWQPASALSQEVLQLWAAKPLADWATKGKDNVPRVLLARFLTRDRLPETNAFLRTLLPRGVVGSKWALNPGGDYDFSLTVLTTILWLHGNDPAVLYPAAREHLLKVLLTQEGGNFVTTAPRTLGLVRETENHILMTEGSRYLKNRWLQTHGSTSPRHDNLANGLEGKLLGVLTEPAVNGLYEFNSQPYIAYTITALLNLEAFGSEAVRAAARTALDTLNFAYALGSYRLRHYPPFRRNYGYAASPSLTFGYQTVFMHTWLSYLPAKFEPPVVPGHTGNHAIIAVALPYRPPDRVVQLLHDKGPGYFVRLGHGPRSSPELYTAGPGFLLSAGGVHRGERSLIAARPITLFLDDSAATLPEVFNLGGPGGDFRHWNNTGVYENFACAAGPVHVPARFSARASGGGWQIFPAAPGRWIAVYSTPSLGLLAVFAHDSAEDLLASLLRANPAAAELVRAFVFPDGRRLTFDPYAPAGSWVMQSFDGKTLDRDFDRWPLISGRF
jgi:hypothetical protein